MDIYNCLNCGQPFPRPGSKIPKTCSLRCRGLLKSRLSHPGLVEDYFEVIDSKEKAYWFGFLMADGNVSDDRGQLYLQLVLGQKDEGQVTRFCEAVGVSRQAIKKRSGYGIRSGSVVSVSIHHRAFVERLVALGCTPRKTATLRFPEIPDGELAMAFVLGYFDGDGSIASSNPDNWNPSISCGSKEFLEAINTRFWLRKKVKHSKNSLGCTWTLSLGRAFYRELLANYEHSMLRKRIPL